MATRHRTVTSQAGITLLEVAMMLTITVAIMGALSPTVSSTLRRTMTARVTTDQSNLLTAFTNIATDTGLTFFVTNGAQIGNANYKIQLIVTDGDQAACAAALATSCDASRTSWNRNVNNPAGLNNCNVAQCIDFFERHLVTNNPGGSAAQNYSTATWRGAYMNGPINPDPWGNRYMVNNLNGNDGANSVIILSSGPDETVQTNFLGNPPVVAGDDILLLLQP
jgi:hypothetical protein